VFFSFQPQQNLIFYSNVSAPLRGLKYPVFSSFFHFSNLKTLPSNEANNIDVSLSGIQSTGKKTCWGSLTFSSFPPHHYYTGNKKRHVRRAGTAQFIVSIHPPTFAFRVVCVCVVICTISLCTGRHVAAPCSSLFSSSWPSFHSLS
jgi:hypothetical protein